MLLLGGEALLHMNGQVFLEDAKRHQMTGAAYHARCFAGWRRMPHIRSVGASEAYGG